jgi:general secretion pathway protein K
VLVVTALMVAVTVELIHQAYVDISLSRGFRDGQQASLVAESGITAGKQYIIFNISNNMPLVDLPPQEDETGMITIKFAEESGKICLYNLVNSDAFTLKALKRLGATQEPKFKDDVWDALIDWVDSDDTPTGSGGAEKPYYLSLVPPHGPYPIHNYPLATFAELSLVKGFTSKDGYTPDVAKKLAQAVTVYRSNGLRTLVNINTAPPAVIAALDATIDVNQVTAKRPFTSTGDMAKKIPGFETIAASLTGNISFKGDVFRITSQAKVNDTIRTVEAVWRMSDDKILSWQEY